jgi:hypothetical protein
MQESLSLQDSMFERFGLEDCNLGGTLNAPPSILSETKASSSAGICLRYGHPIMWLSVQRGPPAPETGPPSNQLVRAELMRVEETTTYN